MASKAMGAAKAVKAATLGLHGVFRKLAREHGEVTALLLRVKSSSDVEVRRELFPTIRAELLGHEAAELCEVYPVFEQHAELAMIAKDHADEAGILKKTIDELSATPIESDAWVEKFDELVRLVKHHVDEEEGEFFKAGERVLGKKAAVQMEIPYERAKSALTSRLLPH
jgi:hypothetical protein